VGVEERVERWTRQNENGAMEGTDAIVPILAAVIVITITVVTMIAMIDETIIVAAPLIVLVRRAN